MKDFKDPLKYPIPTSILRDSKNKIRTQSLFLETNQNDTYRPIFTLKEYNWVRHGISYPSLKLLYLEIGDPTEYEFAMAIFGSWRIWQRICNNQMIKKEVDLWREELELRILSQSVKAIMDTAATEGSKGTTAAKWLADKGWLDKRGRPSKEELKRKERMKERISDDIDDYAERVGLNLVKK